MNAFYGALIMFFYFIKYPLIVYLGIHYFYLELESNFILDILGIISIILIVKDFIFPHQKPVNCSKKMQMELNPQDSIQ
jgi:hypothetical protein